MMTDSVLYVFQTHAEEWRKELITIYVGYASFLTLRNVTAYMLESIRRYRIQITDFQRQ